MPEIDYDLPPQLAAQPRIFQDALPPLADLWQDESPFTIHVPCWRPEALSPGLEPTLRPRCHRKTCSFARWLHIMCMHMPGLRGPNSSCLALQAAHPP